MPSSQQRRDKRVNKHLKMLEGAGWNSPDNSVPYVFKWQHYVETLALTRRKWEGLPDTIDIRYLEEGLFLYGKAVIFEKNGEFLAQQVSSTEPWDAQENFGSVTAWGGRGTIHGVNLDETNSVVIWDNLPRFTLSTIGLEWAKDLAQIEVALSQNIQQQKSLFILSVEESQQEDAQKIMRTMGVGDAGMLVYNNISDVITPTAIQTGVKPIMAEFNAHKDKKLQEIWQFLGIEHLPIEKAERLITTEAQMADGIIARHRQSYLDPCIKACDRLNKIFGWNCRVSWAQKINNTIELNDHSHSEDNHGEINTRY